jgi:regulator of RNase E activity RraA
VVLDDERIADEDPTVSSTRDRTHALSGLTCADLVDAMGRVHRHRCHVLDLVSPTPGRVLFGPAATISYYPSCSVALDPHRYNFANLFYEAVGDQPAGKVLVLGTNGYTNTSMGGGTKLFRLQEQGLYVYADAVGAVVIPEGEVDDVLAAARKIEAEDEAFRARIAGEVSSGPSTGASER